MPRRAYPSDVTDEEWLFVSPYLTLMREDAPQREDALREVFNGLCWVVRTGAQWCMMPNDLPPWHTVYRQSRRWLKAKVFEVMVHGLRGPAGFAVLRGKVIHQEIGRFRTGKCEAGMSGNTTDRTLTRRAQRTRFAQTI